jgi:hypothetical protein
LFSFLGGFSQPALTFGQIAQLDLSCKIDSPLLLSYFLSLISTRALAHFNSFIEFLCISNVLPDLDILTPDFTQLAIDPDAMERANSRKWVAFSTDVNDQDGEHSIFTHPKYALGYSSITLSLSLSSLLCCLCECIHDGLHSFRGQHVHPPSGGVCSINVGNSRSIFCSGKSKWILFAGEWKVTHALVDDFYPTSLIFIIEWN